MILWIIKNMGNKNLETVKSMMKRNFSQASYVLDYEASLEALTRCSTYQIRGICDDNLVVVFK